MRMVQTFVPMTYKLAKVYETNCGGRSRHKIAFEQRYGWILGFLSKIWRTKAELNNIARYGDERTKLRNFEDRRKEKDLLEDSSELMIRSVSY